MSLYEKFFKFKNENIKIIRTFQKKGFWQALQYWCVRTGTLLLRLVYKVESYLFFEINLGGVFGFFGKDNKQAKRLTNESKANKNGRF